jgi:glutamate/tyrosine decarboxylase-like PLP-dependent enzyme
MPDTLATDEAPITSEIGLDPEDWEELRRLGHRMLDDAFAYLENVRERPVWQPVPEAVKRELALPLPLDPTSPDAVYEDFKRQVLPYPTGNIHPRFWGWVMGTGTPLAMLADMLASAMNPHVAGYDQSAAVVETQVLSWLAEMLGFPATVGGVLTSSGTVANLIGLAVARNSLAGFDVRADGVQPRADRRPELIVYTSTETHSWVQKAVELMGLGHRSLRRVRVDARFRMDLAALARAIADDRARGARPLCVVATAGTVNTGAVDDLPAIAALCREQALWFHVDGAFGSLAALSARHRDLVRGQELADSIAFDLHKWLYMPFEAGCVLVRDRAAHQRVFALTPSYLSPHGRGIAAAPLEFAASGLDLSRGFKALKLWFSIRAYGSKKLGAVIAQNIDQARYLEALIESEPQLELLAPGELNVVCFRFNPGGRDGVWLDRINEEVLLRLQETGEAVPSGTRIRDSFVLRVAITNHRSRREDFCFLVERVLHHAAAATI